MRLKNLEDLFEKGKLMYQEEHRYNSKINIKK